MADKILDVKLKELDEKIDKLHCRIQDGEYLSDEKLKTEILNLQVDLDKTEKAIFHSLKTSKADISAAYREDFEAIREKCAAAAERVQKEINENNDSEKVAEQKSLLAEYGIDIAIMMVEYALLLAMEAIEAERISEKDLRSL